MKQFLEKIEIQTNGKSLIDITKIISGLIFKSELQKGLINLSILHTSASLIIQENADKSVQKDILDFFEIIVPENAKYSHISEGLDDMPAHLKTILTQTNLTLSIINKKLIIGDWQGIFLFEHRYSDKIRFIQAHMFGE